MNSYYRIFVVEQVYINGSEEVRYFVPDRFELQLKHKTKQGAKDTLNRHWDGTESYVIKEVYGY